MTSTNTMHLNCRWQPFRFLLVGLIATLVHLAVAESLILWSNQKNIFVVNVISFMIAFVISYLGHRYITFSKSGSICKFFMVAITGFAINNIILKLGLMLEINEKISLCIAVVSVPTITYIFSKIWAFK